MPHVKNIFLKRKNTAEKTLGCAVIKYEVLKPKETQVISLSSKGSPH